MPYQPISRIYGVPAIAFSGTPCESSGDVLIPVSREAFDACFAPAEPLEASNIFLGVDGQREKPALELYMNVSGDLLAGDWDGDGVDTIAWRDGNTFTFTSSNSHRGGELHTMTFGRPGDEVVVGDWDGDGVDTIAVRRGVQVCLRNDLSGGTPELAFDFGKKNDRIFSGDWDGDGKDTLAVRRGASLHLSNSLRKDRVDKRLAVGNATSQILVGDLDGDGRDDFVARNGNRYVFQRQDSRGGERRTEVFGDSGDFALIGTWTSEGEDSVGIYRP